MSLIQCRIVGYLLTIVMHISNMVYMGSALKGDVMQDPDIRSFSTLQARYFTCWTFFLQILHAFTGLCCDILTLVNSKEDYKLPKHLRGFRDTLFSGIVFPSSFLVSSVFWSIYLYDRRLIFPPFVDKVLTTTSNHIIHTAIVPVVLWEVFFQPRRKPKSHSRNLKHLAFHFVLYLSVLIYTYIERGIWLYPIFTTVYGTIYFPLLIAFLAALVFLYYYMHWSLVSCIWPEVKLTKKIR